MKDFRDLLVWKKAHSFVLKIYAVTRSFPREEQYGITSQLRRAAVSIPTNTAEGCGRISEIEFARYLEIAFSSACETEYLLLLSRELEYLDADKYKSLADEVCEIKRMLLGLLKKLKAEG
jgi:four helix bundle protein